MQFDEEDYCEDVVHVRVWAEPKLLHHVYEKMRMSFEAFWKLIELKWKVQYNRNSQHQGPSGTMKPE